MLASTAIWTRLGPDLAREWSGARSTAGLIMHSFACFLFYVGHPSIPVSFRFLSRTHICEEASLS